ncbi:MAG: hypothetical protein KDK51_02690 [Deltaproteobacteria bacterium]|nr:hypothetical protein [Deltaproteobacteria bacterium]
MTNIYQIITSAMVFVLSFSLSQACEVYGPDAKPVTPDQSKPDLEWIIFDVGGVLAYDLGAPVREYLTDKYQPYIKSPSDLNLGRREVDLGEHADLFYWHIALLDAGVPFEVIRKDKNWKNWEKTLIKMILKGPKNKDLCNNEIIDVAKSLKEQGYHIAILSDDSREMSRARRQACGFNTVFDDDVFGDGDGHIFISSEVAPLHQFDLAYKKPQKGIYLYTLDHLGIADPSKALFIDNKIQNLLPNPDTLDFDNPLHAQTGSSGVGMYSMHFVGQNKGKKGYLPVGHPNNETKQDLQQCLAKIGVRYEK